MTVILLVGGPCDGQTVDPKSFLMDLESAPSTSITVSWSSDPSQRATWHRYDVTRDDPNVATYIGEKR